jgi:poly-gamma-glutamate synthesis protein (capsule biosynthesis protein)
MLGAGSIGLGIAGMVERSMGIAYSDDTSTDNRITLFLCGDVMTGRGIDQILPHPTRPRIYESYLRSATDYVKIAERENGPIPRKVAFDYIWGDALNEFRLIDPDLRIINLETAITTSEHYWPRKGINYRMHPSNTPCLTAAGIDGCALANNHVLDWGYDGLAETVASLNAHGIEVVGAGHDRDHAEAPLIFDLPGQGRLLVYAFAHRSSGVPSRWRAGVKRPGVAMLDSLDLSEIDRVSQAILAQKRAGDLVVVSIHWGGNWGYEIPSEQQRFAHWLVERGGVDVVHGHSSHHPKGIELYRGRPIFYGCGDFLNDYEGIGRYDAFRNDLTLAYFLTLTPRTGRLIRLQMTPLQIRKFRLHYPLEQDREWLRQTMERECSALGGHVSQLSGARFELETEIES